MTDGSEIPAGKPFKANADRARDASCRRLDRGRLARAVSFHGFGQTQPRGQVSDSVRLPCSGNCGLWTGLRRDRSLDRSGRDCLPGHPDGLPRLDSHGLEPCRRKPDQTGRFGPEPADCALCILDAAGAGLGARAGSARSVPEGRGPRAREDPHSRRAIAGRRADDSEIGARGSGGPERSKAGSADGIGTAGSVTSGDQPLAAKSAPFGLSGSRPAEAPTSIIPHAPRPAASKPTIPRQTRGFAASRYGTARSGTATAMVAAEARDSSNAGEESGAGTEEPTW